MVGYGRDNVEIVCLCTKYMKYTQQQKHAHKKMNSLYVSVCVVYGWEGRGWCCSGVWYVR